MRTLTGTFVLQRKYSFTLDSQYKWFCSSPKVHFVTELEPLKNSDEYYSLSHSVCVTLRLATYDIEFDFDTDSIAF